LVQFLEEEAMVGAAVALEKDATTELACAETKEEAGLVHLVLEEEAVVEAATAAALENDAATELA